MHERNATCGRTCNASWEHLGPWAKPVHHLEVYSPGSWRRQWQGHSVLESLHWSRPRTTWSSLYHRWMRLLLFANCKMVLKSYCDKLNELMCTLNSKTCVQCMHWINYVACNSPTPLVVSWSRTRCWWLAMLLDSKMPPTRPGSTTTSWQVQDKQSISSIQSALAKQNWESVEIGISNQ